MYRMIDGELTAWKSLAMERCENDTKSGSSAAHCWSLANLLTVLCSTRTRDAGFAHAIVSSLMSSF